MSEYRHLVHSLFWLIMLVGFISAVWLVIPQYVQAPASQESTETIQHPAGFIPPPSAEVLAQLERSRGFQALISYTDNGFEPSSTTLKKGEAVRFTNNSNEALWVGEITRTNTKDNPNIATCGETDFNSCKAMKPGEFWEYSFYTAGEFSYMNNALPSHGGSVVVE